MTEWNATAYNRLSNPMQTWDVKLRTHFAESMTEQSAADDPPFRQDYWRLNIAARRPR